MNHVPENGECRLLRARCVCRAAYAVALLHDSLGMGLDDRGIMFTDAVRDASGKATVLDWTLGAFPELKFLIQV